MTASALFDRILESTTTTGTGTLTLSGAVTGYQSFAAVGDSNTTPMAIWEVDANGNPSGAWETAENCVYTTSGTTLSRGTFRSSSTGSAISFAAGTKRVAQALPAGLLNQSNWIYAAGGADAAPAMAVNTWYNCDISGYTADRTATLPATAAVGDRIAIAITTGDTAFELLITAAAGDTLGGVAGGTEWSRLFITGEFVCFRCVVANTTWIVESDRRIPQTTDLEITTAADGESAATFTRPTQAAGTAGAWTARIDNASLSTVASDRITARRAGNFQSIVHFRTKDSMTTQKYASVGLYKSAAETLVLFAHVIAVTSSLPTPTVSANRILSLVVDDYLVYKYRTEEGSLGTSLNQCWFGYRELLP